MRSTPVHRRLPRAGIDPISDSESAWTTISMAVRRPLRVETIVLLLDDSRRGLGVAVVSGTERPGDAIAVVECVTHPNAHGGRLASIVVGTVRPEGGADEIDADDVDRWLEMSEIAERSGVELLEWFVIGRGVSCPRDLLAEPPRW